MRLAEARSAAIIGSVHVKVAMHLYELTRGDRYGVIVKVQAARRGSVPRVHVLMERSGQVRRYMAEDLEFLVGQGGSNVPT